MPLCSDWYSLVFAFQHFCFHVIWFGTGQPHEFELEDVRAKIFLLIDFFKIFTAVRQWVTCARNDQKLGVTNFVSEIKRVENYPDFEKLPHLSMVYKSLMSKISKECQRGQMILVIFCRSWSVTWIIPNVAYVSTNLYPVRGIWNRSVELDGIFCKTLKHLIDRWSSVFR